MTEKLALYQEIDNLKTELEAERRENLRLTAEIVVLRKQNKDQLDALSDHAAAVIRLNKENLALRNTIKSMNTNINFALEILEKFR